MSTTTEANMAAASAFFGVAASGDLDVLDDVVHPDYVMHDPSMGEELRGVEGAKVLVSQHRRDLGDLDVTIHHQFGSGDYVATHFTAHGTHSGEIAGVAPTGREVALTGICVTRCRDGKVIEEWEIADVFGLLRQIGALPEAAPA